MKASNKLAEHYTQGGGDLDHLQMEKAFFQKGRLEKPEKRPLYKAIKYSMDDSPTRF